MDETNAEIKRKAWYQVWWEESVWPGLGLFGESYMLFSIGTLRPVWELLYPECWAGGDGNNEEGDEVCSDELLHSLSYNVVMGVICGMIIIGTLANRIGRRRGSILTALLMAFGALGLSAGSLFFANDAHSLFRTMSALLFVFGIGVGGEYPLSASSASERAMLTLKENMAREEKERQKALEDQAYVHFDRQNSDMTETNPSLNKGKRVILVFAMQGMGIFINSLTLTFLLLVTNQLGAKSRQNYYEAQGKANEDNYYFDGNDGVDVEGYYDKDTLLGIWRVVYAIGAATLSYVLVSRMKFLEESQVWKEDQERREHIMTQEIMMKEVGQSSVRFSKIDGDFIPDHTWDQLDNHSTEQKTQTNEKQQEFSRHFSNQRRSSLFTFQADAWNSMRDVKQSIGESVSSQSELMLLLNNYGLRLFGTSMTWLLWDVAFYGNKLFQSSFLLALTGEEATLFELSAASTLNAFLALLGYFAAAFIVDKPSVGRLRLQEYGFLITGSLFCLCGIFRENLPSFLLIIMYFGSSFFGQCGPNCTTFVYPAEVFPTEMRTMCHGVSASAGKVGALISAVLFNYLQGKDSAMFFISGYCCFVAYVITFLTLPETVSLDLYEIDKKWRLICAGKKDEYEGPANESRHLSYCERI